LPLQRKHNRLQLKTRRSAEFFYSFYPVVAKALKKVYNSHTKTKGELMELGLVGLPNVGKSTLFNAITRAGAESANYPFCTIEPNIGVVDVPDKRLDVLAEMYHTRKVTPASLKFVDIAGLVKGASRGEGLGNKFLGSIREVEAIVHVVRCFEDEKIIHVEGSINPLRDIETINTELALADLETLTKQYAKVEHKQKTGDKSAQMERAVLDRLSKALNDGISPRILRFNDEEQAYVDSLFLITTKPVIYACNISESFIGTPEDEIPHISEVRELANKEHNELLVISAKVEQEISELPPEDRQMFLEDLGLSSSGLDNIIRVGYRLLGQISYLTAGEKEVRAWTIINGTKAPGAAGKIHSDFEKGFIKAEVVSYDDLINAGSYLSAKEQGKVRIEGKDYVVKDGDIMLFKFNV